MVSAVTYYSIQVTLGSKSIPKWKSYVMGLSPQESNINIHSTITLHESLSQSQNFISCGANKKERYLKTAGGNYCFMYRNI